MDRETFDKIEFLCVLNESTFSKMATLLYITKETKKNLAESFNASEVIEWCTEVFATDPSAFTIVLIEKTG